MVNLLIAPGAESRLASESPKEKIHSPVFEPLFPILDKYWGYEYSDLPVTLRFRIAEYFSLIGWDACNISNRVKHE